MNGKSWQPTVKICNNAGYSDDPHLAVAASNVFIIWTDGTGAEDIFFRSSTDNGASWKSIKNLSNNSGYSASPQVTTSGSNVFVVWQDETPGNNDILFRRSIDGGVSWQTITNLSNNSGPSQVPQVALWLL
jgi:hypothetical protein